MACVRWSDAIQELVDGTLGPIRKAELQQHLDVCPDCRAFSSELTAIAETAASLDAPAVPNHVWLQIAGRLRHDGRVQSRPVVQTPRRLHIVLAAAAVLLIAAGSWMIVAILRSDRAGTAPAPVTAGNAAPADAVQSGVEDLRQAETLLQSGLFKLREGMGSDASMMPSDAADAVDQNLQILDLAIAESSAALQQEPQNGAARNSLFDALQRKISLLQDTIALMNELRKGNAAGASQLLEGGSKS